MVSLILAPLWNSWRGAREDIAVYGRQLDELGRKTRRALGQRKRLAERYGPAVNKPLSDLQTAQRELFGTTEKVLKSNGFGVTGNYDPQQPRRVRDIPGRDVYWLLLRVRGKCKQAQLSKCLAGLRTADTPVIVDRLTVKNNAKKPGELEVTMMLGTLAEDKGAGS